MKLLTKREVEILHLLTNSKGYQTGKSIAVLLGVTSRTVRNDIKKMNVTLQKHGANIVSRKGTGYELEIFDEELFQKLHKEDGSNDSHVDRDQSDQSDKFEEEIIRNLLMNALTDTGIHQEALAEELFISLSALKCYLPVVKSKMKNFDLDVVTDRFDGIKIAGDEDKIRFCISEFLFNKQSIDVYNDLFPKNEIVQLKEITLNALLKYQLKLTDVALENLIIHIVITIRRSMNNKLINHSLKKNEPIKDTKEFVVANKIVHDIKARLHMDIHSEIHYITRHLIASSRLSGCHIDKREYRRIQEMLQNVIGDIKEKTSIDFSEDHKLIDGLIIHLSVALERIKYQMNIRNDILTSIKNNYPLAFQLAVIASNKISKVTSLDISENEIGFLAIHFGVALEKKGLNKQTLKKIIIVCGSGIATASLIREKILNNYGQQVSVIETLSLAEFKKEMLDDVDLVVSTITIPDLTSEKIVRISPIISDKDLSTIKSKVLDQDKRTDLQSVRSVFKKDLFIKNLDLHTKEEVLYHLTTLMLEKGYIDDYTKTSIIEREKMASTELSNLLAIPHPLDNNMTTTSIAVCILKKPIVWDKEKVQVVILLSVPKDNQKSWEKIFKKLYHFLIEDYGITKLISEYSYEDFLRNLTKYKE